MQKIIYPLRDLSLGLMTAGEESERPWNSCSALTNYLWKYRRWKRKSGSAIYNATFMATTEEVRGGFTFNDGTINCILAFCDGSGYKTTGDGSMGSALTEPDTTAVTWANANLDVFGVQIRNRLYLYNGDTTDEPLVFDGTYLINYSRDATNGTADADGAADGSTLIDSDFGGGDDDWNGQYIEITHTADGTKERTYVSNYAVTGGIFTLSPKAESQIKDTDTFTVGVAGQEERNGKFATLHKNRIFNAVGSLLYYTVPYYPDWWGPEDGYVTLRKPGWKDGEDITALAVMDDNLIVFKPHNIYAIRCVGKHYLWQETKIVGTDSNKGCVWHKTLKRGFGGLIYHSWDGVYVLDRSLNVHCVSRNIEPTIQALQQSVSNPGGMSSVTKIDTSKVDFDAGTDTNIDTTTVSGTFRVDKTAEVINQEQTTQDSSYNTITWSIAQSFKVSINCFCTKAQLYLKKVGSPGDLTVYLKADNNNSPGDTLASATISAGDVGSSFAYEDANWTDTELTADTRYWLLTPKIGDMTNYYNWGASDTDTYANGNPYVASAHIENKDTCFKIYEQHYESSSNLVSRIHDLGATPTQWRPFNATETLNGCSLAWYMRADDKSDMADNPAWVAVENGGTPSCDLEQYTQYRCVPTPTNVATPVVDDVTIQAYLGTAIDSPCAIVHDKKYWLSIKDTSSDVNSCVYVLDEEALMYGERPHERWSKLEGLYINDFLIFNDQLMGTSVGGTGKGGFLYYLDTGTKDLGVDFTTTLITQKLDFSNLDPTYRDREKVYKKMLSKYKSQQDANLYYKIDAGSWSSAITLSAQANVDIEEDWFVGLQRGKYLTLRITQATADPDFEWHSIDILCRIARLRG